jgi:DNA/RNA-binding protein KIN17
MTLKLGEKYYKKKGIVINVENRYHAIIKMLEINEKIRIDQAHVETVIPAIGRKVLVVNGAYRGQEATLEDIHQDTFSVDITLLTVRVEILFFITNYKLFCFRVP